MRRQLAANSVDLVETIAVCGTGGIDFGPPTKLDDSAYEGLVVFRQAIRRFLAFSETKLRTAGVTSQQYVRDVASGTSIIQTSFDQLLTVLGVLNVGCPDQLRLCRQKPVFTSTYQAAVNSEIVTEVVHLSL